MNSVHSYLAWHTLYNYFAEYFVTGYWRKIVVVLICELDITKEDYCDHVLSKRSCNVYRLLGSGVHVRTYVGTLTVLFLI